MARINSIYICQSCGAQTRQFFGRCSSCGEWNSIVEEVIYRKGSRGNDKKEFSSIKGSIQRSERIDSVNEEVVNRLKSKFEEFDRVLGGGLVPGSIVLVGGEPGIGKSTLLLQSATRMANTESVLYISAEESAQQVRLRWERLEMKESKLNLLAETDLEVIEDEIKNLKPDIAIIDSIQALNDTNLTSAPGSVSQVRECSAVLQKIAKNQNTAIVLVGHVTKEGILAGPKVLEHLVDAVLTFEGDRFASHRLLRAVKNRYGATHELGVFEMQAKGLIEVNNPSEIFLSRDESPGVATIVAYEGTRSIAIEIQALVNTTTYASPRRTATGIETNRLHQILAVLEKKMNLALSRHDCYLAVAGGLNVEEPAADLGIAAAIISSYKDISLPIGTVLIGELGLGGQLRTVRQISQRICEASRLGFNRAIVPISSGLNSVAKERNIEILQASTLNEALLLGFDCKTRKL